MLEMCCQAGGQTSLDAVHCIAAVNVGCWGFRHIFVMFAQAEDLHLKHRHTLTVHECQCGVRSWHTSAEHAMSLQRFVLSS